MPDDVPGYDGVHDDKDRTEYNLGVAGYLGAISDISGYWPGICTSSCMNEDALGASIGAHGATVEVWHRTEADAEPAE